MFYFSRSKKNQFVLNVVILLLFICLPLLNCNSGGDDKAKNKNQTSAFIHNKKDGLWKNKKKLNFEEILSIGDEQGDDKHALYMPVAIQTDEDGNIYICDRGDHAVKVYDKQGRFLYNIGHKGMGQGELINPYLMALAGNKRLIVVDRQRNVNSFSLSGKFLNSFKVKKGRPYSLFCDAGKIYMTFAILPFLPTEDQYKKMVFVYNFKGEVVNSFGKPHPMGEAPSGKQFSSGFICGNKKNLVLACESLYKMEIYSTEGHLESVIDCEADFFPQPELVSLSVPVKMIATRSEIKTVNFFADGRVLLTILGRGTSYKEEYKKKVRPGSAPESLKIHYGLFDDKGHLLQNFDDDMEKHGVIIYIDSEGFIYAISSPYQIPVVRKYRISFIPVS